MKKETYECSFVEYWSTSDSRNCIANAIRFCEVFGYSMDELRALMEGSDNDS